MKVLVVGATGETGRRVVETLIAQNIPVRAMVRNLNKGKEILPSDAELVVGDLLDKKSLPGAIADCDHIICTAAARPSLNPAAFFQVDYVGTKSLIDAAVAQGVEQFILVTSLCVSKFFHPLNLFGLVLFWKKQTEAYLINSSLNYTIVRPGGLNAEAVAPLVLAQADTLFEGRIPRQQVAELCVAALDHPQANRQIIEAITDSDRESQPIPDLIRALGSA
ncbi:MULTISPECIES: SDR family oxidoreductase [Cyanophyceae]|uniref:SDR family oxidoreductase n=1 Tax=Cyanophyceae TaxID=3028117 RepID=UPI00016DCB7D|nr:MULTISPECIES: SDR family oxidoreductase [Cyanophyceae]ACA99381.1 NAD dependent epimerase/dehydratase family [Picosynechococcus sp. PCC 7002]SMH31824.1 NAD(P)H-binding [Picosynechococcus sp. OG1]SMQ84116.1 NAD(P)H-binding [Synechococcus sp. 7002]